MVGATAIEAHAPVYLRNVIRILTETGLRVYKELAPLRKEQVDLANKLVFIADSKTPTGVAEVPLTDIAVKHSRVRWGLLVRGRGYFQVRTNPTGYQTNFKKCWERACERPVTLLPAVRSPIDTRYSS